MIVARVVRAFVVALVFVAGCDRRPVVPSPRDPVPTEARHEGERLAAVGPAAVPFIRVYDDNIYGEGNPRDGTRLYIASGHVTEDGYLADRVVLADHVPKWLFRPAHAALVSECTGTATYADGTWTIALGGSPACESTNGVFRARPLWVDSWDDPRLHPVAAAPEPPPTLTLVLPPATTPFARAIAELPAIEPSDQPCGVTLRLPSAESASGARPDEVPVGALVEREGESFEVVRATSGAMLPSEPGGPARYQVLYVRTAHRDPRILDRVSFVGGRSQGRAYLVDMTEGRVVCAGDVSATNGDSLDASSQRSAEMWLALQLAAAERRAIALHLRALVPH